MFRRPQSRGPLFRYFYGFICLLYATQAVYAVTVGPPASLIAGQPATINFSGIVSPDCSAIKLESHD
jgi:hypothetical protein